MKVINQDQGKYIIRFDRGEDVISGMRQICSEAGIHSGAFSGIGACSRVVLAFYDLPSKQYREKTLEEELEIVSLNGNVGLLDQESAIHAHGSFGSKDYHMVGGHITELIVSGTCEIYLVSLSGRMHRAHDSETGLNLLQ